MLSGSGNGCIIPRYIIEKVCLIVLCCISLTYNLKSYFSLLVNFECRFLCSISDEIWCFSEFTLHYAFTACIHIKQKTPAGTSFHRIKWMKSKKMIHKISITRICSMTLKQKNNHWHSGKQMRNACQAKMQIIGHNLIRWNFLTYKTSIGPFYASLSPMAFNTISRWR